MLLSGRKALVTGSTQGVGQAIAVALANAGADVVIHGLEENESATSTLACCRDAGVRAELVLADLIEPATDQSPMPGVDRLFESALTKMPGIDLLVNNAGTYIDVPFLKMDMDRFDRTMRLNVYAYYFLTQAFARHWVAQNVAGRILLIGSINGRLAEPTHTAYDASKGAVEMMVKSMCVELAPLGIRVNGLAPGLFHTPLTAPAVDDVRFKKWMQLHTPNGSVPNPDVAGDAAAFLLSDAAQHIHGHMLMVDGGLGIWQQPDPPLEYVVSDSNQAEEQNS